eukprot:SAG11_NODE_657_length_7898_cov_13.699320_1_plen_36_part_10
MYMYIYILYIIMGKKKNIMWIVELFSSQSKKELLKI